MGSWPHGVLVLPDQLLTMWCELPLFWASDFSYVKWIRPMIPNLLLQDSKRVSVPFLSWVGLGVGRAAKLGWEGVWGFECFQHGAW